MPHAKEDTLKDFLFKGTNVEIMEEQQDQLQ